ncbi:MAG: hypothetical protein ACI9MR_000952 [Myxococcota bacterium]|jgi:hypothetical protein
MRTLSLTLVVGLLLPVSACTSWGQKKTIGETYEVSRTAVGAAYSEHRSSMSATMGGNRHGVVAEVDQVERDHCLQQVEIVYAEPFEMRPAPRRRWLDIMGSAVLMSAGLSVLAFSSLFEDVNDDGFGNEGNGDFAPGYVIGGLAVAGGAGWLIGSLAGLPAGEPPPIESSARRWTVLEEVDSDDCQVEIPMELQPGLFDAQTIEDRLIRLEALRDSGTITLDEYDERRRAIVEEL